MIRVWDLRAGTVAGLFSYVSFTFLYLPGPKIQAIDSSLLVPKCSSKNINLNDYEMFSVFPHVLLCVPICCPLFTWGRKKM